ncbi:MAG TPA: BON domain-containing protein [Methylomirabilota bacterium]
MRRRLVIAILLIVVVVVAVLIYKRDPSMSLADTFRSVKETSQDAATTSKVKAALMLSKHVSAFDVNATTNRGEVTLTGEVPTQDTRLLAEALTEDTSGVKVVHNRLTVNPGAQANREIEQMGDRVADLEIKTIVMEQLARNPDLKDRRVTVQVNKRIVQLDGAVDTPAQRRAIEQIALQTPGVQGLAGQIQVTGAAAAGAPQSPDDRLARRVEFELYSTRALPLERVEIRSQDGTVYLTGPVGSRAEKLLAERVAQSVDGVKRVVNNLTAPEGTASR